MYKAVFLDMDGTLLRSDHSVSEKTIQTIQTLTNKGIPVILVSARPLNAVLPTFYHIGLPKHYPIITLNGSYIVEAERPIFQAMVDPDTTAAVTEQVRPFGATIAYYLQREWYSEVSDSWTDHEQKIMDVKVKIGPISELVRPRMLATDRSISPVTMMKVIGSATRMIGSRSRTMKVKFRLVPKLSTLNDAMNRTTTVSTMMALSQLASLRRNSDIGVTL